MITRLKLVMLEQIGPHRQNALAKELGINQARVSQYMTGLRKIPPHHLLLFARAFNCSPADLIGYVELPTCQMKSQRAS